MATEDEIRGFYEDWRRRTGKWPNAFEAVDGLGGKATMDDVLLLLPQRLVTEEDKLDQLMALANKVKELEAANAQLSTQAAETTAAANGFRETAAALEQRAIAAEQKAGQALEFETRANNLAVENENLKRALNEAATKIAGLEEEASAVRGKAQELVNEKRHLEQELCDLRNRNEEALGRLGAAEKDREQLRETCGKLEGDGEARKSLEQALVETRAANESLEKEVTALREHKAANEADEAARSREIAALTAKSEQAARAAERARSIIAEQGGEIQELLKTVSRLQTLLCDDILR